MLRLPSIARSALPWALPAALTLTLFSTGCDAILGIRDVETDPTGSGGSGGSTTSAGGGGSGGSTTSSGGGGSGGSTASGDFTFGVKTAKVILPLGGQAFVDFEIVPKSGFNEPVTVSLEITPTDVAFQGVTIPAGETTGQGLLGAEGVLSIGDTVPLSFLATAGNIEHKVAVTGTVTGEPGKLVESFGAAGVASWVGAMDGTNVYDVREVAQGKIITTGDHIPGLALYLKGSRVLPSGAMDTGFGPNNNGTVTAQFCGCTKSSQGRTALREIGGRVLMIGTGNGGTGFTDDIAIARYKDNGTFDDIGQDGGKTLIDLGGVEYVGGAALGIDGLPVVAVRTGTSLAVAKVDDFFLGLDNSFGNGGATILSVSGEPRDIAVDPDTGDIVLLGSQTVGGNASIILARMTSSGALTSFGPNGSGVYQSSAAYSINPVSLAIDSKGRIVVAGWSTENADRDTFAARFLPDGTLDDTFGTNGVSVLVKAGVDYARDMVVLRDDRIVVGGMATQPFLVRFLSTGAPDPTFGGDGHVDIALGAQAELQSMGTGADGEIFLAGSRESQPSMGFVAKVWQ